MLINVLFVCLCVCARAHTFALVQGYYVHLSESVLTVQKKISDPLKL